MTDNNGVVNLVVSGAICVVIAGIFVSQLLLLGFASAFFGVIIIPIGIIFAIAIFVLIQTEITKI